MALVTTVVACDSSPTSAGMIWCRSIAMFSAISTPRARSSGVVGTLATPTLPLASSTRATSVKVPPISIPIRHAMPLHSPHLQQVRRSGIRDVSGVLTLIDRLDVEIDHDGFVVAAHKDTFERFILARIDFLVRHERRHIDKIAWTRLRHEF